ncbi:unnamed protein product [Orchesella dallaii]|uniref:Ionotropic glutamate receptor C-terminal domain-containing protein n=1 Tax=Orchesella dallaii TaxID=48710 RepID=A0ABP1RGP6_9HEXA
MTETHNLESLTKITTNLVDRFGGSTVEFLWDENNPLTLSILAQCIIFQCILLHFNSFELEPKLQLKILNNMNPFGRNLAIEFILESNFQTFLAHRHSSHEIIVVSDSSFPSVNQTGRLLHFTLNGVPKHHHRKYPSVIISRVLDQPAVVNDPKNWHVSLISASSILLFVATEKNEIKIAYVASLDRYISQFKLQIKTVKISPNDLTSILNLRLLWEKLQLKIHFQTEPEPTKLHCSSTHSYAYAPIMNEETCVFKQAFFQFVNCSNLDRCDSIHKWNFFIKLNNPDYGSFQIFPFAQSHIDFTMQILFPKESFFDSNLTAFLNPFNLQVWITCLIALATVSLWLIGGERQSVYSILFWQPSIVLEQSAQRLINVGPRGSSVIGLWMLVLFFTKQFYGSSLYSFMTTEKEVNEFPISIHQVLLRSDYYLFTPRSFISRLHAIGANMMPHQVLFHFYLRIISKSLFNIDHSDTDFEIAALQNASHGKFVQVISVSVNRGFDRSTTLSSVLTQAFRNTKRLYIKLERFVTICEGNCMDGAGFFGQTGLNRRTTKERPVLIYYQFWFQVEPNFQTFRFAKFLSRFVSCGLYQLEFERFKKLQQFKLLSRLKNSTKRGWSNGSLFSYSFLDQRIRERCEVEKVENPMKIAALKGTFILVGILGIIAMIALILEFQISKFKI